MRHEIRAMLHQLAENGRLGIPDSPVPAGTNTDTGDAARERPRGKITPRMASTFRKAQDSAVQR